MAKVEQDSYKSKFTRREFLGMGATLAGLLGVGGGLLTMGVNMAIRGPQTVRFRYPDPTSSDELSQAKNLVSEIEREIITLAESRNYAKIPETVESEEFKKAQSVVSAWRDITKQRNNLRQELSDEAIGIQSSSFLLLLGGVCITLIGSYLGVTNKSKRPL